MHTSGTQKTALPLKWDLSPLAASDSDHSLETNKREVEEAVDAFVAKWQKRTDYLSSVAAAERIFTDLGKLYRTTGVWGKSDFYFRLRRSQDENDPTLKAKAEQSSDFFQRQANKLLFFNIKLGKVSPAVQKKFLQAPELAVYGHYLDRLFTNAKYFLTEPEEKVMGLMSGPAVGHWTRMTSGFLAKELRHGKNLTQLAATFSSLKKTERDRAAADLNDILQKNAEIAENEMNAILSTKKIDDELRGYARPDTARHISDDIDTSVVDAMTTAVEKSFKLSARYYRLKAKILGVKSLKYWERAVPYGQIRKKYTYDQSVTLVRRVFTQLHPEFASIFDDFVQSGRIDVFPHQGKHGGAFCYDWSINLPIYVLLNHTDRLNDVLTLAHEMGHGINGILMRDQNIFNYGAPTSMAEVASTFMEDFVLQDLLKTASPSERMTLYVEKLDSDISSIFRQVAAYNFEKELHAKFRESGYLTAVDIGQIFKKHMSSYLGPAVDISPGAENYWVYWSHFRNFFYVYSYASGLLISKSLQAKVKKDPKFIENVKEILSAGSSESPKDIFQKHAGIDISQSEFWTSGLNEVESLLVEAEKLFEEVKR